MASIKREESADGPRWRVRYRRPDGSETSRRFDRRGSADDFAARVEHDRRAGTYIDPAGPRTTFAEMAALWVATVGHQDTTARTRDSDLRCHVLPALGRYRIGQITALELERFLRGLEASLAPTTVERIWRRTAAILAAAVRARMLTSNPAIGLGPATTARRAPLVALEEDQVEAIIAGLPGHYRAAAVLAADAGLRGGEVFGLTVGMVGLPARRRRILRVERQLITLERQAMYVRLPKEDRVREVPVGESVFDALADHMAHYRRARTEDRIGGGSAELVFATSSGAPVRRNLIDQAMVNATARAGLPKGVRFHDLRHYYASVLIAAGRPEREVGAMLGQSSAGVTATYGHLFRNSFDAARDAVDASIAARKSHREVPAASISRPRASERPPVIRK
jgi:integrase